MRMRKKADCEEKKKGLGARLRRVLRAALILTLILAAAALLLEKNLEEVILDMAYAKAEAMAV